MNRPPGCYSQAALSSNDSKTLYKAATHPSIRAGKGQHHRGRTARPGSGSAAARPATQNENEGSAMSIVFLRPTKESYNRREAWRCRRKTAVPYVVSTGACNLFFPPSLPPGVLSSQPPPHPRGSQGYGASNTETVINEAMFANGKSEARGGRPPPPPPRRRGTPPSRCVYQVVGAGRGRGRKGG